MVEPLKPFQIDEAGNIRCGRGTLKTGKRKGEPCPGLILPRETLTVACHNCGERYKLLDLYGEAKRLGYLGQEEDRWEPSQEKRRHQMPEKIEKRIKGLKKIIESAVKEAAKDEEKGTVIELTMIGENSPYHRSYSFLTDRFIGIRDDIVIYDDCSGVGHAPLALIEHVKVRKFSKSSKPMDPRI